MLTLPNFLLDDNEVSCLTDLSDFNISDNLLSVCITNWQSEKWNCSIQISLRWKITSFLNQFQLINETKFVLLNSLTHFALSRLPDTQWTLLLSHVMKKTRWTSTNLIPFIQRRNSLLRRKLFFANPKCGFGTFHSSSFRDFTRKGLF